jgi:hypothetical protein
MVALLELVPDPARCPDCGGRKLRTSIRCAHCHGLRMVEFARQSPAYTARLKTGHGGAVRGPIGPALHAIAGRGYRVRAFHDRLGAVVLGGRELVWIETDEQLLTDRVADMLTYVGRARSIRTVVIRDRDDVDELVAGLPNRRWR